MENAHLRLGLLEYVRITEKASTRIRLRVDRYIGEDRQAHLLSVFGNDSDVGAITAAVHEKASFTLTFPDGRNKGCHARRTCLLLQRSRDSARTQTSGTSSAGGLPGTSHQRERRTNDCFCDTEREEAWATLVSFLGLPADPTWADAILGIVEQKKRIEEIDGIGCQPVLISATTEEMLEWIGDGLRSRALAFPEGNGAVIWPRHSVEATLNPRRVA